MGSGRVSSMPGRAGRAGGPSPGDEAVTVQGRFEDGFIRASFVVHADGRVEALGRPDGPPRPPLRALLHRLVG